MGAALAGTLVVGAASAVAFQVYPSASAGVAWAGSTPWSASAGFMTLTTEGGQTILYCTSGTVAGTVDNSNGTSLLHVTTAGTGNGFTGCNRSGSVAVVKVVPTWTINGLNGSSPDYSASVAGLRLQIACGPTGPVDYVGTVPATFSNSSPASAIKLSNAGLLNKTPATVCPTLPTTVRISVTYTATSVNNAAVSASNNLWLKP